MSDKYTGLLPRLSVAIERRRSRNMQDVLNESAKVSAVNRFTSSPAKPMPDYCNHLGYWINQPNGRCICARCGANHE